MASDPIWFKSGVMYTRDEPYFSQPKCKVYIFMAATSRCPWSNVEIQHIHHLSF